MLPTVGNIDLCLKPFYLQMGLLWNLKEPLLPYYRPEDLFNMPTGFN